MTLRNVRNAALVVAVVSLVVGVVLTATEDHHEKAEITIGEHVTRTVGGLTFNIDTIISTLVAGAPGAAPRLPGPPRADQATPTTTSRPSSSWSGRRSSGEVNKQVEDNLGKVHPYAAPLAISLFFFILFATGWRSCRPSSTTTRTCCRRRPRTPTSPTRWPW